MCEQVSENWLRTVARMVSSASGSSIALRVTLLTALVATSAELVRGAEAVGEPPVPLLGYCAPPVVPTCLAELKADPERLKSCGVQAEAYEATVFGYRACLEREMERAVREANGAMARLRCAQKKGAC